MSAEAFVLIVAIAGFILACCLLAWVLEKVWGLR